MKNEQSPIELTEDSQSVGPGQMLADARKKMGLSVEQVAKSLNFRTALVKAIEAEQFEQNIPSTYTRGYLKNYAKLVHLSVRDVLASYEALGIVESQPNKMQSFSKRTSKQAENNRIMYIGYLMILVLVILTIVWWFQQSSFSQAPTFSQASAPVNPSTAANTKTQVADNTTAVADTVDIVQPEAEQSSEQLAQDALDNLVRDVADVVPQASIEELPSQEVQLEETAGDLVDKVYVVFTFAGDCWVNIYDGSGERIAWGIKKADYVMTISGIPPFTITLGKPELVTIEYDNVPVNMAQFPAGHIAKFELPLNE